MYQIAAQGRVDLAVAPDEATGLAMTLLRMLAFAPAAPSGDAPAPRPERAPSTRTPVAGAPGAPPSADSSIATMRPAAVPAAARAAAAPAPAAGAVPRETVPLPADAAAWPAFVAGLALTGMAAQLAAQTELKAVAGNALTLALPVAHKHLADKAYADKLKSALEQATGRKLLLAFEVGAAIETSLAATEKRERAEAHAKGEAAFRDEPFVRELLAKFDGQVKSDTVTPIARDAPPE
jgi:DNA polymerase-3 subunit gamma/tau